MPFGIPIRCLNCDSKLWKNNRSVYECGTEFTRYYPVIPPWWKFWNQRVTWVTREIDGKYSDECQHRAFAKKVKKVIKESLPLDA
jgi:hypothetical protein